MLVFYFFAPLILSLKLNARPLKWFKFNQLSTKIQAELGYLLNIPPIGTNLIQDDVKLYSFSLQENKIYVVNKKADLSTFRFFSFCGSKLMDIFLKKQSVPGRYVIL